MKSVLLSIRPKYCELIASGKKTVEVRKTKPKIEMPFKCYIYCAKNGRPLVYGSSCPGYVEENLVQTFGYSMEEADYVFGCWNGKVIGEFICDEIVNLFASSRFWFADELLSKSCLSLEEIRKYANATKRLYGWHISNLIIYDEPKELNEFTKPLICHRGLQNDDCIGCWDCEIKRPPRSWCYVEDGDM